jgi:hypothetical protein
VSLAAPNNRIFSKRNEKYEKSTIVKFEQLLSQSFPAQVETMVEFFAVLKQLLDK